MWTAEAVLVCALSMLGRSQSSFPPIEFVRHIPFDVSARVEAYVRFDDPRIYIVTTSTTFQRIQQPRDRCTDVNAIRKLASILIHEEVHLRQGADEKTAYQAQLTMLTALGAGVGSPPYMEVVRAMRYALEQQRRQPARLMAAAQP